MKIVGNYDLIKLNTFGISAKAKFFAELENETDLKELFGAPEFKNNTKLFLGGGSNVLFVKDFDGLAVLNKIKGIEVVSEDDGSVVIRSMGGEVWHSLVLFAVERGWWGIENLSLIPGTVGAAPMQNIGAYGAELKDVLVNIEAYEIETGEKKIFAREACELAYRDSIFKNKLKNKYFISAVTLKLDKKERKNLDYKVLAEYFKYNQIEPKSSKDISDAVSAIRRSKLPDPTQIPNAGSFFKNVFIEPADLEKLQKVYPQIPYFTEDGVVKIPAAWLIEGVGWKGKRLGNVGVHDKQALVLVNHGGAEGQELLNLSKKIIADVKEKFGLTLVPEVNIV